MRVSIIGTGYVGLVTGACLADKGHDILCVDIDCQKVDKINNGIPPIFERGLEDLLQRTIRKNLLATTDLHRSVLDSEITLVAVGTPFERREIDLTYVKEVSRQIGIALKDKHGYHVVVVKSTVVPGTTDEVVLPLLEENSGKRAGRDFGLGMNPEFLTEGQAITDFMHPDRIVLGANDERAMQMLGELYAAFEDVPKLRTNCKTAEMIKYASNAMLATQISFANEIANLCSTLGGVDIVDVMKGVHLSNYLSPKTGDGKRIQAPISSFLEAGCGFGGSCLPKDVKALIAHGEKSQVPMPLLNAVVETNKNQPKQVIKLLNRHFTSLENIRISILGLSFKPETDDMRDSPAIPIIKELFSKGAILKGFDPAANDEARRLFKDEKIMLPPTLEDALSGVDAVVLVTKWEQFRAVPEILKKVNPQALFVDGRRMLNKHQFNRYEGIGL
jgi:UDPglucose 6-dehydrogenase/GDP-mannose 6-dehydrogenase